MIKGLKPSLAVAGHIKIGGLGKEQTARGSGRKYRLPVKWNHIKVTTTRRDADGRLEVDAKLMAALPKDSDDEVRAVPVVLHSDVLEEVFPTTYALYGGKKVLCRGDGETAQRWNTDQQGNRVGDSKPCKCPCSDLDSRKCKPNGTLRCSIVAPGQAVAGAVHIWRTTSIISIRRMLGSIAQIFEVCGTIRGLPLTLKIEPVVVTPDDGPAKTVHCCHLELRAENLLAAQQQALQLVQMRQAVAGQLEAPQVLAQLPAPAADTETDEEQAEVAAEFYSEQEPDEPGRHEIPEPEAPPQKTTLDHIADVLDTVRSEGVEKWLRKVIATAQSNDEIEAASKKLEILLTNRAKDAAERDRANEGPPHDPATGEVEQSKMDFGPPTWADDAEG